MSITIAEALDLVQAGLSRTRHYPRHEEAELSLARGLQKAAKGMEHARGIIERCSELSEFCPTDHDLLTVGRELIPAPAPPSWTPDTRTCPAGQCDGHGWARVFFLVTEDRHGDSHYRRRERITADVYAKLTPEVDNQKQRLYEAVKPCPCTPRASAPEAA